MMSGASRLNEFCQNSEQILGVRERNRRPERPVPRPRIEHPNSLCYKAFHRHGDIIDGVPDVMNAFATLGQESTHRRVGPER